MRKCNCAYNSFVQIAVTVCALVACFCRTPSALAVDPATTITVDAATVVAESGGDDLATVKNIFQDANAPQDGATGDASDPRRQIMSEIGMKRIRVLQGDVYCDLDDNGVFGNRPAPDAAGNYPPVIPGDCDLKWQIDWALLSGLSPHVAVAYYMPQSFVQYGPAETWPAAIFLRYQSYAKQLVKMVVKRSFDGGASSVIFEVSNELDLNDPYPLHYPEWMSWLNNCSNPCAPSDNPVALGFAPLGPWGRALWWMDPTTFNLSFPDIWDHRLGYPFHYSPVDDVRRVTRGIGPMQKMFANAVTEVSLDAQFMAPYQGKTIKLAGPAFADLTFTRAEDPTTHAPLPTLEETFIGYMFDPTIGPVLDPDTGVLRPAQPTLLDYVSFHYYGDFRNGAIARNPTTSLKYITDRFRAKLTGHPETRLFISEWGPTADETSDVNYSHKGAAWTAAFLTEAVADHIAMGAYLIVHDFFGAPPAASSSNYEGILGVASLTHKVVTNDVATYHPKPPANVFKMFTMMTGTRKAVMVPSTMSNLGAFAASDDHSASVVVFNYPYDYSFTDVPQTFALELDSLPFDGAVTVQRYLVDANTSNLKAFREQSGKPDPGLQMVEQFTAYVQNGQLILTPKDGSGNQMPLGLGVTCWRVTQ